MWASSSRLKQLKSRVVALCGAVATFMLFIRLQETAQSFEDETNVQ